MEDLEFGVTRTEGGEGFKEVTVSAYPHPVDLSVSTWHSGDGGGDSSTAMLALFKDGIQQGEAARDSSFNSYDLHIPSIAPGAQPLKFYQGQGTVTNFRIEIGNSGATTRHFGVLVEIRRS